MFGNESRITIFGLPHQATLATLGKAEDKASNNYQSLDKKSDAQRGTIH